MKEINIKRAYDKPETSDGYRVFVDKFWLRGEKKEDFHYDFWAKNIAPSDSLREWFHEDTDKHWEEFKSKYLAELKDSLGIRELEDKIKHKKVVTLLYGSKNVEKNNAVIVKEFLEKN